MHPYKSFINHLYILTQEGGVYLLMISHSCVVMAINQNPRANPKNNKVRISSALPAIVETQENYNKKIIVKIIFILMYCGFNAI